MRVPKRIVSPSLAVSITEVSSSRENTVTGTSSVSCSSVAGGKLSSFGIEVNCSISGGVFSSILVAGIPSAYQELPLLVVLFISFVLPPIFSTSAIGIPFGGWQHFLPL